LQFYAIETESFLLEKIRVCKKTEMCCRMSIP
jgi:hypothetical protein